MPRLRTAPMLRTILGIVAFAVLTVLYWLLFRVLPRTSDQASILLAGQDMLHGNWRLSGWWMSPDNFSTMEAPFYAALLALFGFRPELMFWLAALIWAAVVMLSVTAARRGGRGAMAAAIAVTLVGLPVMATGPLLRTLSEVPIHTTTIAYLLVCFLLLDAAASRSAGRLGLLAGFAVLLTLCVFGDPMALFIGVLPILLVTLRGRPIPAIRWLGAGAGVLALVLLWLNERTGGFLSARAPFVFVTAEALPGHLAFALKSLLDYFSADFLGRALNQGIAGGPLFYLLRLPLFLLLLLALTRFVIAIATQPRRLGNPGSLLDDLLAAACLCGIAAAAFSSLANPADWPSGRYYLPSFVFGAVLVARMEWPALLPRAYLPVALLASAAMVTLGILRAPPAVGLVTPDIAAMGEWLAAQGLARGYGPYWMASIITVATREQVVVRPLTLGIDGGLEPMQWLASDAWYRDGLPPAGRRFVLVHDTPTPDYFSQADVIRRFGPPGRTDRFGGYIVDIYGPEVAKAG